MEETKKCASGVWDCGSSLYDSYELNSLKRQIDSAIVNSPSTRGRSLSMPHLPERRRLSSSPPSLQIHQSPPCFKSFKFFQKLLRFVFNKSSSSSNTKSKVNSTSNLPHDRLYVVQYDKYCDHPVLSTIPELPEFEIAGSGGALSPEISSLVRKSASERFTPTPISISCA